MAATTRKPNVFVDVPRDLVWCDDRLPGIRRRRAGKGFTYVNGSGKRITDGATLARIKALAIPPAWTNVWICADPAGHVQATGRDAKGRKQYRYHPQYRAHRDAVKFEHLYEFGSALSTVRKQVARDVARPGMPKEKVVATVIRLLETTLVRVGNEEYARDNASYGLTTLRDQHAKFPPGALRLVFKGKHGIATDVAVHDARLRRIVKRSQDLPGEVLFQFVDDDGEVRPISSGDVNDYLRDVTGFAITAKDFRTWMGTLLAAAAFAALPPPRSDAFARKAVARVCESVSEHLGNTPAVCRASYIHPKIVEWYRDGSFAQRWAATPARGSTRLVEEERKLLALLRPARRRRAHATASLAA